MRRLARKLKAGAARPNALRARWLQGL